MLNDEYVRRKQTDIPEKTSNQIKWDGEGAVYKGFLIGDVKTPIRVIQRAAERIGRWPHNYEKSVLFESDTVHLYHISGHIFEITNGE